MERLLCIVGGMNAGGAETFLMKLYRALDKTKYQMDFAVAITEKGHYDDEILSLGGKIHHITPKSKGFFKNFNSMRRIVRDNQYKYVLRTSQHALSALELLAARLGGAKVCVFRSSNSNTVTGSKKDLLLHKLCGFMPRRFANVWIAPSTEAAEFMFGKGCVASGKVTLVHNAVDLDYFKFDPADRVACREELQLADRLVIGHVGRFNQQKNHGFLLEVFAEIARKRPDAVLLLVGKGELEQDIRQKAETMDIADKVIFAGVRSDIPRVLSAMDVFVFPSLYEGMPNTVIEAQATGLPCVIADTITPEADVTGLVQYLPLSLEADKWAEAALQAVQTQRKNTHEDFMAQHYNIEGVAQDFVSLVFRGK